MTYKSMAKIILMDIGGCENIVSLDYCRTRLRFAVKCEEKTNPVHLKDERGIIGVIKSRGEYQVVTDKRTSRLYKVLKRLGAEDGKQRKSQEKCGEATVICAPLDGSVMPLAEVGDEVFAKEILGKGAAIIPETNLLVAPAGGKVTTVLNGGHAISLMTEEGLEVLMHIGIDTINLKGKNFNVLVEEGDFVRLGDPLVEFDAKAVREEGFDLTSAVVVLNDKSCEVNTMVKVARAQKPFMIIRKI